MVCPYCQSKTTVFNSRHNASDNKTWRRRKCTVCNAIFSTEERVQHEKTITYRTNQGALKPFSRITLLMSVYEACRHLKDAETAAEALTNTILSKLNLKDAVVSRDQLVTCTQETLSSFNNAAAVAYGAFHPL